MIIESRKEFHPWDSVGFNVNDGMTTQDMLKAAKLDWEISKEKLYFGDDQGDYHEFRGNYGLIRTGTRDQIGICGPDYHPIQNAKAFEFFEKFMERGEMRMEAIGSFKSTKGLHVWALASLSHQFVLPGDDVVKGYVLLSHPHIWGQTLQIKPTAMRIYCYNSLMAALRTGEDCFKHWHHQEFGDSALDKARAVVSATIRYVDQVREKAEFLASKPAEIKHIGRYIAELMQPSLLKNSKIDKTDGFPAVDPILFGKNSYKIWESIFKSPGNNSRSAQGTWWGVVNGVTHAVDHKMGRGRDIAMCDAWLGSRSTLKVQALDLAVQYAKAA